jgi:membrane fusion protein, copper/silver efflux system
LAAESARITRSVGIFCLLAAVVSLAGWSWRGRTQAASPPAPILYYVDPMHPAYKSDRPGTAPDCGMRLEPVYANAPTETSRAASDDDAVRVRSEMQRRIGVRVQTVARASTSTTLRLYGRIAADETRIYRVNAGIDGYISDVSSVTTGSRVEAGEWLATLVAPESATAVQAYLVAAEAFEHGTQRPADTPGILDAGLQQATDRLLGFGMSPAQLAEIKRTRAVSSAIRITAPSAGFVIARSLSSREKFATGQELFRIADLRRVWIQADVVGRDAAYVKAGATADVMVPDRGLTFQATISRTVPPQFDAATQAARVRLETDNPNGTLRPEMLVDVRLPIALPEAIAVPADAVLDAGRTTRVFVERADGAFEPREVQTGWRFGDRVEIVRGLAAGDRVVTAGAFLLDSESRMRHDPTGALPPQ